jgi:hypothetical protein
MSTTLIVHVLREMRPRRHTLPAAALLGCGMGTALAVLLLLQTLLWRPLRLPAAAAHRIVSLSGLTTAIPGMDASDWWATARSVRPLSRYSPLPLK